MDRVWLFVCFLMIFMGGFPDYKNNIFVVDNVEKEKSINKKTKFAHKMSPRDNLY